MKTIRAQELIKSDQFIREPVDSLCKEIINNSSKKIILTGGRGIGKSTVLYNMENKGLDTENQTICAHFESCTALSNKPNELFNERFFIHYYELNFCFKLLSYVRKYYYLNYENFKDIELLLKEISKDTTNCINNISYNGSKLKRHLNMGEISLEILERIKLYLDINSLSLAIDRFDWTNDKSEYVQNLLSKYFELFDKVILTTDDLTLNKNDKKEIENNGYSFIPVMYGKKLRIIKKIIKKRIKLCNYKFFDENAITNEIYKNLINKSNGNISLMLDTVSEVAEICEWEEKISEDLSYQFDTEINNQLDKVKKLKKMDIPPKFYLR